MSPKKRFDVLTRCKFRCSYCGATAPEVKLHVDHILPRAAGGTDEETNLTAACSDCNIGKSDTVVVELVQARAVVECSKQWTRIVRRAPGFLPWLRKQTWRDDPVGDLARDVQRTRVPRTSSRYVLRTYFIQYGRHVMHAFYTAWREFNGSESTRLTMRKLRARLMTGYREFGYRIEGYRAKVDQ